MTSASIQVLKKENGHLSISVAMPIWVKQSTMGNHLNVKLPLIGLETIARDEDDIDEAVSELLQCFCIAAEKYGQSIEKELQSIGWKAIDENGEHILGFCVSETDELLDRLIQTGDNYINPLLEVQENLEHA